MIETHLDPDRALSDARQQITPKDLIEMLERLRVRNAGIEDQHIRGQMAHLRAQISHVDAQIIQNLAERMRWVEEIGKLKQEHNIPVLQIHRWENLLHDHLAKAEQLGLDSEFVKAVFELIHAQAVRKQL
jgi:chorismate mutase